MARMIRAWTYRETVFAFITEAQIPAIVENLHDAEVEKYLYFAPITLEGYRAFTLPLIEGQASCFQVGEYPASATFTITQQGELLGTCGIDLMHDAHNCALIGYMLKRSAWGRGIATSALQFLIHYAKTYLKLRKLFGDCMTANIASARVMEKCGFIFEGTISEKYEMNGRLHDNSWYGLRLAEVAPLPDGAVEEMP